ncbi:MAG: hypothetical protein VX544_01010 [Pseudomonadota bacterium]|nr:hypothetical protein [Pseudomonadota bacterium]|tara:strand:- start:2746 stop:2940 length:195 start_codon:yes stop_codon:yes gene_type:complete
MDDIYREATTKMEELGIQDEYIIGWQGGYLGHPEREETRATDAYEAGYEDGKNKDLNNLDKWKK